MLKHNELQKFPSDFFKNKEQEYLSVNKLEKEEKQELDSLKRLDGVYQTKNQKKLNNNRLNLIEQFIKREN